jgi:hypothetical protein
MLDMKATEEALGHHLRQVSIPQSAETDARVLVDAMTAMRRVKPSADPLVKGLVDALLASPAARLTAAGIVALALAGIFMLKFHQPVWALAEAIEALKQYRACSMTILMGGTVFECWAKAEPSGELSDEIVMKGSNGVIVWVKDNQTFYYDPRTGRVEVDDAKTAGFSPWLGPELFRMISRVNDAQTSFGVDPATGLERVVMTGSMTTAIGPISWIMEFDLDSKLPISYTQWDNSLRSGAPACTILKITYHERLPEAYFAVDVPAGVDYVPKPIILPEANLALLGNPEDGLPTDGLSRAEAARRILAQVYAAAMAGDIREIQMLCPLTRTWSDELMRTIIIPEEDGKRLAEMVHLGEISREGTDRLGPYVVVPARLRTRDGRLWDEKQIVQFRLIDGRESCVVFGPYGMVAEVDSMSNDN